MTEMWQDLQIGFHAAVYDMRKNLLHPFRNLREAFGLARGESLSEIVERVEEERLFQIAASSEHGPD